jgi:hypothetical protein
MRTDELITVTDKQKKEIRSRCSICKGKGSLKNGLCEEHGLQRRGIKERGEGGTYFTFCNSVKELQTSLWTSLGIQDLFREEGSGESNVL